MASERKKFRIPTAADMEEKSDSIKPQDTFAAFKRQEKMEKEVKSKSVDMKKFKGADKDPNQGKIGNFIVKPSAVPKIETKDAPVAEKEVTKKVNEPSLEDLVPEGVTDETSGPSNMEQEAAPPTSSKGGKTNSLLVNSRQRGNPILKFVRNIPWEYGEIVPDYVMGLSTCALYLSLRYHQLNPNYIHDRLKQLGKSYHLRILLVQVDIKEPHHLLKDLAKICILADFTLILAFSPEEAGRYLESYKVYEFKPPDAIMEKTEQDFVSKLTECLTTVKSVNKTDALTLLSTFKTLEGVMNASKEDLSLCPGFGPQKAQRVHDIFREPFLKANKSKKIDGN